MPEMVTQKSPADAGLFVWSYWLTETTSDVVASAAASQLNIRYAHVSLRRYITGRLTKSSDVVATT
jgi:hypothetical protein